MCSDYTTGGLLTVNKRQGVCWMAYPLKELFKCNLVSNLDHPSDSCGLLSDAWYDWVSSTPTSCMPSLKSSCLHSPEAGAGEYMSMLARSSQIRRSKFGWDWRCQIKTKNKTNGIFLFYKLQCEGRMWRHLCILTNRSSSAVRQTGKDPVIGS